MLKPAPGRAIRDPRTMQLVPKEGIEVDRSDPFWARAIADHDLVEAHPHAAPADEKPHGGRTAHKPEGSADR